MFDVAQLAKAYGLPDLGLDDPRLGPIVSDTLRRHREIIGAGALEGELETAFDDVIVMKIQTTLLGHLAETKTKATDLSDEDLTGLVEQATDTTMMRHWGAPRRAFKARLPKDGALRAETAKLLRRLPEARRTGADDSRHAMRLSSAARRITSEIIMAPVSPETMFKIEDILIEETVYAVARKAGSFVEMGDAELLRTIEAVRDQKSAKIARLIREDR